MPVSAVWHIEGHIIQERMAGKVTLDEIESMAAEALTLIEASGSPRVHILVDVSELASYPKNLGAIRSATKDTFQHPSFGWFLVHGQENPLIRVFTELITNVFRVPFRLFATQEAALGFLVQNEPGLAEVITSHNT